MRLTTNIEGQAGREVGRRHSSAQHSALITIILNIYSLSKCSHWALMRCPARVDIFTAGTGVGWRVPMASNYTPAAETQTQQPAGDPDMLAPGSLTYLLSTGWWLHSDNLMPHHLIPAPQPSSASTFTIGDNIFLLQPTSLKSESWGWKNT